MTESHIVETFSEKQLERGIETADRLLFDEYTDVAETFEASPSTDGAAERMTELERAMTALRFVSRLLEDTELTDEEIQEYVSDVSVECAGFESMEKTAEIVESALDS